MEGEKCGDGMVWQACRALAVAQGLLSVFYRGCIRVPRYCTVGRPGAAATSRPPEDSRVGGRREAITGPISQIVVAGHRLFHPGHEVASCGQKVGARDGTVTVFCLVEPLPGQG